MPSIQSRMIYKVLKFLNVKDWVFKALLKNPGRGKNEVSAKKLSKKLLVHETDVDGFKMLTICGPLPINKHIILFHGGAYVAEANRGHRVLIEKLALDYKFKVSFIDYPLAPEHTVVTTHKVVDKAFEILTKANKGDEFFLFGDSAGGGLALAFLQLLRDRKAPVLPRKTVLLSPWLDVTMANPDIGDFIHKDVVLQVEGLKKCGRLYAGDRDSKDPIISPIYGSLENLKEIQVFVSSHELFYPDCMLLKERGDSVQGTSITLSVKEEMLHDWVVIPIQERDATIEEIADFYMG